MDFNGLNIIRYNAVRNQIIEEFFYGDEELWNSRSNPHIHFKHLFRQIIHKFLIPTPSIQAKMEGVHRSSITNSLEVVPPLEPIFAKMFSDRLKQLIDKHPYSFVKRIILEQSESKTNDELAKQYSVHVSVIERVILGKELPINTLNYLFRQCTPENKEYYLSNM